MISREAALPEVEPQPGKGEVLWRSLAATTGDLIVFVDSDLIDPDPMFVPKLLGPLLIADGVHLVKGFYRRPLKVSGSEDANGGGRVTELVARPLLAALRPELTCLLQPLGGEYAGTRELLTSVPFAPGYGVEIGLLIDTYDRLGLEAIAQVNLGVRTHRNRPLTELAAMSRQVIATLLSRCGVPDSGRRAHPVLRRRRRLHPTDVDGVAGRPAADDHAAAALDPWSLRSRQRLPPRRPAAVGRSGSIDVVTLILLYLVVLILVAVVLFGRGQRAVRPRRAAAAAAARDHRHGVARLGRHRAPTSRP